jgi:hypothetical protein
MVSGGSSTVSVHEACQRLVYRGRFARFSSLAFVRFPRTASVPGGDRGSNHLGDANKSMLLDDANVKVPNKCPKTPDRRPFVSWHASTLCSRREPEEPPVNRSQLRQRRARIGWFTIQASGGAFDRTRTWTEETTFAFRLPVWSDLSATQSPETDRIRALIQRTFLRVASERLSSRAPGQILPL